VVKIPIPPLEEQKRIAGILDQADALRRLRTRALDKLNTLGQAIFHEMFGDELRNGDRRPLAELIDVRSSLDDPKLPENSVLPHVGPEHIPSGSGRIDWSIVRTCCEDGVKSGKYRFEDGDVIFSKIRPYLNKVAMADRVGMCSADMYALHVPNGAVAPMLLHFILGSNDFLAYTETVSNRANIPKMNRSQLLAYEMVVPDMPRQIEFQLRLQSIEQERSAASDYNIKCEGLFNSLQHRAFRGEL
jgi:type I restriction enzyme S subunit